MKYSIYFTARCTVRIYVQYCVAKLSVQGSTLIYVAVQCSNLKYVAVQWNAVKCSAVECNAVQCPGMLPPDDASHPVLRQLYAAAP